MPTKPKRDSRRPAVCMANRKMTISIPWSERGDFIHESIIQLAESSGGTHSGVMMKALEWYFTNQTPVEFFNKVNSDIESTEYKRTHKPGTYTLCNRMGCTACYSRRNVILANRKDAT